MISDDIYPQGNQSDLIKFKICLDSNTPRFTVIHKVRIANILLRILKHDIQK